MRVTLLILLGAAAAQAAPPEALELYEQAQRIIEVASVIAGAAEILKVGPNDTPQLELTVLDGTVHVTGEAISEEDVLRLYRFRDAFPEVLLRVKLPRQD